MEPLTKFLAAFLGFFVCMLVWSSTVRWVQSVWLTLREWRNPQQSKVQLLVVLFLHSGPWLLGLAIFFVVYILSTPHRAEWEWFFGGALFVPPVIALLVLRWYMHRRRLKDANVQS